MVVEKVVGMWENIKDAFAKGVGFITSVFEGVLGFFRSIWQGIVDVFRWAGRMILNILNAILAPFRALLDGLGKVKDFISGGGGGRASGGLVNAGSPVTVGEHGPETFVPMVNGRILTARQTSAAGGGGETININVEANVSSDIDMTRLAIRLGDMLRTRRTGVGATAIGPGI